MSTMKELRSLAKERGVKGYSQLRKSDLIDLIESKCSRSDRSLLDDDVVASSGTSGRRMSLKTKWHKGDERKNIYDIKMPTIKELRSLAKERGVKGYSQLRKSELIDLIESKGSRSDRSLLDDPVPDINVPVLVPTIVPRMIKTAASKVKDIVKKSTEAVIDWAEWLRNAGKDIVVKHVSPKLKMLKEKVEALFKAGAQQTFELKQSSSSLKKFATQYVIEGREGYDPQTFFSDVKRKVTTLLENNRKTKVKLILRCIMEKTKITDGQTIEQPAAFHSDVEVNLEGTDVNELYDTIIDKVMENIANFQMQGSNWTFKSIIALEIHTVAYEPLRGSSYIPLPRALATRKTIINLKNQDDECFRWAVLRAMNPTDIHPERIDKNLKSKRDQINMDGIEFPVSLKSIDKVEKQNPSISINVFGYEDCVYPLRVSKVVDKTAINLLLISDDEKQHYCLIENMSRLLSSQTGNQQHTSHYCMKCLNPFHSQEAYRSTFIIVIQMRP